ncbi:response regulator transcription factor [Heyndrickxia ginsengihumi]|uniref:Chemotaxis protein CheY n=1 Tax=Heyndrickxia ginsengihumi TaxID=363870 RepID=A0A0A6VFW1_9BACI|nr:response regulator [Heyndrickxia ginsengihumi]KHD86293.1 chemotaxis protein CheY [Heyndrickxia ginsengihumi]MCM3023200.1 response regulator [Heyndrickxia ginsengihumi]
MNILIVDDEILELEQLTFLIHQRYPEWRIYEAEDAAVAKRILQQQTIDLSLLDIHLPGETGLDLCSYIRNHYKTECIMVTAHAEFQYAQHAIKLQVFDYIVKPIITEELYRTLDRYMNQYGYLEGISSDIRQVVEIIRDQYYSKMNLTELAEKVHVSPNYLSRKFSKEIGMSFQEYLVSYRIEIAKNLLQAHPDWSIQKISEETGFASIYHFSQSFKKHVNEAPTKYKEGLHS